MLFADDSILLGSASTQIARNFIKSLDLFLLSSGSKVNLDKCQLFGWHNNVNTLRDISQILNIKVNHDWTHFSYLGIPVTKKFFTSAMCRPIIQKIKNKILFLGFRWLNIAGKITLIQSILSSYPIYIGSMILTPKMITNSISMQIRKFLW